MQQLHRAKKPHFTLTVQANEGQQIMLPVSEIALSVAFALLVFTDIFGNSLVCFIVLHKRFRLHRSSLDKLLVNLAVADMLLAVFVLPRYVLHETFTHPRGDFGDQMCRFVTGGNFIWIGGAASIFCLVVIAFERRQVVLHPYNVCRNPRENGCKLKALILTSWLFAFILNVPLFFVMKYDKDIDFCVEEWPGPSFPVGYGIVWFMAAGIVPITLMVILYTMVVYHLWIKNSNSLVIHRRRVLLARRRATKVAITVTVIYAVCWLPILFSYLLAFTASDHEYGSMIYRATVLLSCLNSSVNPFVYGLQSSRFRRYARQALLCRL